MRDGATPGYFDTDQVLGYWPAGGFNFVGSGLVDTHFDARGRSRPVEHDGRPHGGDRPAFPGRAGQGPRHDGVYPERNDGDSFTGLIVSIHPG